MSFIKVEATNRQSSELRSNVDRLTRELANLKAIADKVGQIFAEGGGAAVQAEYDLESEQDGTDLNSLIASAAGEARPFMDQYISRCG